VTVRRCSNCGGLVGPDVEWCGQCYARVEPMWAEPAPERRQGSTEPGSAPEPSARGAAAAPRGLRVDAEGIVWTCPTCGSENPLDASACDRCGTRFGRLFETEAPPPRISAERAAILSLVYPGIGHLVSGKLADGMARAVVFAFSLGMVLAILLGGRALGGPLVPLLVLFIGVSATLYVATAVDAYRAVRGEPPVLSTRLLLIGATVLLLTAMVVLILGGSRLAV
jgi:hypothetical protein